MITIVLRLYEETFIDKMIEDYRIVGVKCYGDSPIEIHDYCYDLIPEVEEWLDKNTKYFEYDAVSTVLTFKDSEDAMMFKLTWL